MLRRLIVGDILATGYNRIPNANEGGFFDVSGNNGITIKGSTNASPHITTFYNSGVASVTIDASRRVGIGTTNPGSYSAQLAISGGRLAVVYTASGIELDPQFGFVAGTVRAYDRITTSYKTLGLTGDAVAFGINDVEKARIDSSGRLLVGTSSTATAGNSQYSLLQVKGGSGLTSAVLSLTRAQAAASISSGSGIGSIAFGDEVGNPYAYIACESDAASGAGDYPGRLVFSVTRDGASSPTEAARISATGELSTFSAGGNTAIFNSSSTAGTANNLILARYGATGYSTGTASFVVYTNGNVQNTNNSYGALSDIKLKENIVDANSQWSDIKALQVRKYNFKEGQTHTQIGLVAQEVELVSPGLVSESPDRDEDGNDLGTVTKSVNYSVLYMKAVKALQEAMERIETLEAKVAALEA